MISRAREETLTVNGESGSESCCEVDQVATEASAADITGGEI